MFVFTGYLIGNSDISSTEKPSFVLKIIKVRFSCAFCDKKTNHIFSKFFIYETREDMVYPEKLRFCFENHKGMIQICIFQQKQSYFPKTFVWWKLLGPGIFCTIEFCFDKHNGVINFNIFSKNTGILRFWLMRETYNPQKYTNLLYRRFLCKSFCLPFTLKSFFFFDKCFFCDQKLNFLLYRGKVQF